MEEMTEQDGKSLDMVKENLEALKSIFPEAFTEDGVDFDTLRQLLGDEIDDGEEKYGLNWHGKKKARQIALTPSLGTLRPCKEESVDWDTTQNLFIEGDNLEVLKLLQKSYANKVKMIYIDPPYNTGKEFIYPDKFQDNLDTYLKYTGQKDDEGFKVSSNTESSGRYHTNWLNMMYPRLKLARNLLKSDGVVFISIDDNEVANLRKVCDEIFGEENFVAQFVWKSKLGVVGTTSTISSSHEYIISYAKSLEKLSFKMIEKESEGRKENLRQWGQADRREDRPSMYYPITINETTVLPLKDDGSEGRWRVGKNTAEELLGQGHLELVKKESGYNIYRNFPAGISKTPYDTLLLDEIGTSAKGSLTLKEIGLQKYFDYPKSIELIRFLAFLSTNEDEIVLDFFSGSCTAAHAVLDLNKEDNGNKKFIMVQLPEPCDEKTEAFKAGYKTIAEIGKERIRRAAAKIKEETPLYQGDLGFKVFKLDSSNIQTWNPDRDDLEQTLLEHADHLVEGRSEEDVLYELLLKRGVDLTVPIEQKEISGKAVYSIGYGVLFACLDTSISREEVENLAQGIIAWHKELKKLVGAGGTDKADEKKNKKSEEGPVVVFRDSAFADDIAKTNMTAILQQNGIAHVRSL